MNMLENFDAIEANLTEEQEDKIDDLKNRFDGLPTHFCWYVLNSDDCQWNVNKAVLMVKDRRGYRLMNDDTDDFPMVRIDVPAKWHILEVHAYAAFLRVTVMGKTMDGITVYVA